MRKPRYWEEAYPTHYTFIDGFGKRRISIQNIVRLEGADNYSKLYLQDGSMILMAITLSILADRLPGFIRIHKSHLINPVYFRSIQRNSTQNVMCLTTGEVVPVSKRNAREVIQRFYRW